MTDFDFEYIPSIRAMNWPEVEKRANKYYREFLIELGEDLPTKSVMRRVATSASIKKLAFKVGIKGKGNRLLIVLVCTPLKYSNNYFFAVCRMLDKIDKGIGVIQAIQGTPRSRCKALIMSPFVPNDWND